MEVLSKNKIKRMSSKIFLCVFFILILLTNLLISVRICAQNVSITIKYSLINNPPVLDPIPDITVHAGNKVSFSPTASDEDGNSLSFSYSGWMTDSVYSTNINDVDNDDATEHFVTVSVSDGQLTDDQEVKVTVCIAYSPLRCINIKPAGVDGITASNRIFRAYPEIEYSIRAAILGGTYPYQFTWEANKPSWLSMNENTGKISGLAPIPGTYNDITIRITDSKGSFITAQWSIEITTENFIFVDAVMGSTSVRNGGTGTGTIDNPFKNVRDWYGTTLDDVLNFTDYQDYFVYYRTGTYYLDSYLDGNQTMSCDNSKPPVHLAYPGESPKFDMENGKIWAAPVYIDGLEFYNMLGYGIKTSAGNDYYTFRNLYMHDLDPTSGINGQSFINVTADSTQGNYWVLQDCKFDSSSQNGIELNNLDNSLIEDCIFTNFLTNNVDTTAISTHPIFLNVECRNIAIRHNIIYENEGKGVFAYLSAQNSDINKRSANIEICFNNIYDCAEAGISVNTGSDGIQSFHAYRNTIQSNAVEGSIHVDYAGNNPPEGPYVFENNIIVNTNAEYFIFQDCSADVMNYVNNNNNLSDSTTNNTIDPTGNLNSAYTQYFGIHGWQKTNTSPEINIPVPDIATNEDTTFSIDLTIYGTDDYDSGPNLNWSISDVDEALFTASINVNTDVLTITPVANMFGTDNITLTLTDLYGLTDTTYIEVTINPVNDAPVLDPIADIYTNEGQTVIINPSATDIDSGSLTYIYSGWMTGPVYITNYNDAGEHTVTVTVSDGTLTSSRNAKVTVINTNRAPIAVSQNLTTDKNTSLNITLNGTDLDNDTLTYYVIDPPFYGSLSEAAPNLIYTPAPNYYGNDSFAFNVNDGKIDSDLSTISITVNAVNSAPIAYDTIININENTPVTVNLNVFDAESDPLNYEIVNNPANGTLSGLVYTPDLNYSGTDSFSFRVYDGTYYSNSAVVSFNINYVNNPPVLNPIGNKTINNEVLEFTVSASDIDNDTLTFTASNLPTGANFDPLTRTFTWLPGYDQSSSNYTNILFTVTDSGIPPASSSENITITVDKINRPPVLNPIGSKTVNQGELLEFVVTAYDPDGDSLTFTAGNLPAGANFNPFTQKFIWVPDFIQSSNFTNILFTVTDNNIPPETDSESITITVGDVNRPPVLNPIGNKTVNEGKLLEFVITGTDEDNDVLVYSVQNLPVGATFDSSSQKFSWYPGFNQTGNYENILFTVTDDGVPPISSNETIRITVGNINHPPVINPIGNKIILETEVLEFTVSGSDVDGDMLTFTAGNLPNGAYFDPLTQVFTWTPNSRQEGIYFNIRFEVNDGTLNGYEMITIKVEPLTPQTITVKDCDVDKTNRLRRIDGMDLSAVAMAFGSEPKQEYWNRSADINKDGVVDGEDLIILCINFGKKY